MTGSPLKPLDSLNLRLRHLGGRLKQSAGGAVVCLDMLASLSLKEPFFSTMYLNKMQFKVSEFLHMKKEKKINCILVGKTAGSGTYML